MAERLARKLPARPITRMAPSPTGYLHLGHVAHALWVYGLAQTLGIEVRLRIEDHDRQRCKPAYTTALLEDLMWLGFKQPGDTFSTQIAHTERYVEKMRNLPIYACACSRAEVLARTGQSGQPELRYDGYCRTRQLDTTTLPLRLRLDEGAIVHFDDILLGPQAQQPGLQCGDVLIHDRQQNFTYQWCVVVDDLDVNVVIRGQDLLASTGRQILMRKMLGGQDDILYLHHSLLYEANSPQKLSKRQLSESLRARKEKGATAPDLLGEAAWLGGLMSRPGPLAPQDVPLLFR